MTVYFTHCQDLEISSMSYTTGMGKKSSLLGWAVTQVMRFVGYYHYSQA